MTKPQEFAAFVGIDWADQEHAICLIEAHGKRPERLVVKQQAESLDAWVGNLRARFDGRPVAVCLEQSRGTLLYALLKYECLVLYPLNPKQLAKYREAFTPSGAKDDPTDAELLCEFVRQHHERLRVWQPDDATTRALRLLTEARRKWVDQRTAAGNRLLRHLKESYPLALELMGTQIHAKTFVALLIRFPTQCELQRASPKQLARWLPKRRRAVEDGDGLPADELIKRIRAAQPLVTDQAVLLVARMEIVRLAQLIGQFHETIDAYERELAKVLAEHPDAELFAPAPGAGPALTPRLVAAFGSDRQRYQSAEDLQRLSGIAPITVQSGKSRAVRMRRACSKFLRQTFHEFAACSRKASVWARAYYDMLRAKGHRHQSAIRALAYKWLRILFRCWQTRTPYDEARYLKQLRLKNSPLLAYLPTTTIPVST